MLQIPFFFLLLYVWHLGSSSAIDMAEDAQNFEDELQARLSDPAKRLELWQRMQSAAGHYSATPSRTFPGVVALHLTSSGTNTGADSTFLPSSSRMWPAGPFGTPMWWPPFMLPFFAPPQVATHIPRSSEAQAMFKQVVREPPPQDSKDDGDSVSLRDQDQETLFAELIQC